jgi:hypothetical protein
MYLWGLHVKLQRDVFVMFPCDGTLWRYNVKPPVWRICEVYIWRLPCDELIWRFICEDFMWRLSCDVLVRIYTWCLYAMPLCDESVKKTCDDLVMFLMWWIIQQHLARILSDDLYVNERDVTCYLSEDLAWIQVQLSVDIDCVFIVICKGGNCLVIIRGR